MRIGIRTKLLLVSLLLIGLLVAVANALLTRALDADVTKRTREELQIRARLVGWEASRFGGALRDRPAWDALADELGSLSESRVTLIQLNGTVLGDSRVDARDLTSLESHANRPEVVDALATGRGSSLRFSDTLDHKMLYVAVPIQREGRVVGVARLAKPLVEVDRLVRHVRHVVLLGVGLAALFAGLISSLAAHWISRSVRALTAVARRMARGDLDARTCSSGQDEVAELGQALDQLAGNLKAALDELGAERDRMQRVLNGMREGVLLLDKDAHVQLANPALREMLLLGGDVSGKTPLELVRNVALKRILDEAAAKTEPVSAELELGELKPRRLLVHATRLPDEPGGLLVVFVDVTDLRRLEALRRDFVSNASHELRTPVSSLRAAAETLRRALESQPQAAGEFVDIIERNAERLHRLIEDLLDLSRIEARQFRLNLEAVEVAPVAAHVASVVKPNADKKRMRISVESMGAIRRVRADRGALEQVLSNLVDNAVKYGSDGGAITVRAVNEPAKVRIWVEDDGPGIEPRHLSRIFERFYRADAGRSRELGGTGLGLSIVKHLVEAMGGAVGVESTPGVGSRFWFTLPGA